ncbi:MAG: hypothetical protein ACK5NK_16450 [Niabella sp.]
MQKFLINEQQKFEGLLTEFNTTLTKFNNRDFNTTESVKTLLYNCIEVYKSLGNTIKQSEAEVLLSEFLMAQRGFNTVTLEKIKSGKNDLLQTTTHKVLQQLQQLLSTGYKDNETKLEQAQTLIAQIITAAIQSNIITHKMIDKYQRGKDAEKTWNLLSKDANLSLGQKRALLIVSQYDCYILFDETISKLQ